MVTLCKLTKAGVKRANNFYRTNIDNSIFMLKCASCIRIRYNFFFKLHLIQYFLLCYNHTLLCKVAYNWLSATLAIYYKYLTKKKRNVPDKERTSVNKK